MTNARCRTICWTPIWNKKLEGIGLEHLLLSEHMAESVVLACGGSAMLSWSSQRSVSLDR
jgi:hypothetical protein